MYSFIRSFHHHPAIADSIPRPISIALLAPIKDKISYCTRSIEDVIVRVGGFYQPSDVDSKTFTLK
jgi:hypothetical protein